MRAADDSVASHFGGIGRRQTHGDGIVMHVQANEEGRAGLRGRLRLALARQRGGAGVERGLGAQRILRLDNVGVTE